MLTCFPLKCLVRVTLKICWMVWYLVPSTWAPLRSNQRRTHLQTPEWPRLRRLWTALRWTQTEDALPHFFIVLLCGIVFILKIPVLKSKFFSHGFSCVGMLSSAKGCTYDISATVFLSGSRGRVPTNDRGGSVHLHPTNQSAQCWQTGVFFQPFRKSPVNVFTP